VAERGRHPDGSTLLELALGELTGRDRADALAHVGDCGTCRHRVHELVETTDQLLLAAPEAEPPAGFESAVLGRLDRDAAPSGRRRGPVLAAAALVLILALGGIALALTRPDHPELAEAAMITPAGRDVGRAWRYEAQPTWVLVSVPRWQVWDSGSTPHEYRLEASLDDGTHVDLGALRFATRSGAWGTTTDIAATRIRTVSVTDTTGHVWCRGTF